MIPKLLCGSCSYPLSPRDNYCGNCGEKVSWGEREEDASPAFGGASPTKVGVSRVTCRLCGSENQPGSRFCEVCGAVLDSEAAPIDKRAMYSKRTEVQRARRSRETRSGSVRGLEGWKVIAVIGAVMLVGLIFIAVKRNQPVPFPSGTAPQSTASQTLLQEIERLRKVVDTNPTDAASVLKLANLLHDGKFIDQAIEYYKKYLALNEKDVDARVDLGISHYERGDPKAAIAEMEKALSFSPTHQLAHFNLGIVNLGSGNIEKAIEWFTKCIALAPESEVARRAQELIDQHSVGRNLKRN